MMPIWNFIMYSVVLALCTTDQKVFIKTIYSSLVSCVGVEREYHESLLFAMHH
jgi:hypothetical protein